MIGHSFFIVPALLALTVNVCDSGLLDSRPSTNAEVLDKLERAVRIKGLLRQLDNLPESDLRELLVQLRALRRSRTTPAPRDIANTPIGQLTDDELLQIANLVPATEQHHKKPYVPLDIPHDLTRIPISKFIEAFRIVHPETDLKALETKVRNKEEFVFGEEERQGGTGQKDDTSEKDDKKNQQKDKKPTSKPAAKNSTRSKPIAYTSQPAVDDSDFDADP